MITIGVDPHKRSHTAIAIDHEEVVRGQITITATGRQVANLLDWAASHPDRRWAIEGAGGMGALLARQLVAAGETVLDVPPTLSARVRLLDRGRTAKTDAHDARAAAIVALRHNNLRTVSVEDDAAVLRLLANRRHDLVAQHTRVVCRLHALVAQLQEGGTTTRLTAEKAAQVLAKLRPITAPDMERHQLCGDLVSELRRLDTALGHLNARTAAAVTASGTTLTDIHGIGPVTAAIILGHTGDITRFPTSGHWARFNGTAPIDASSGPIVRHRLNPRGDRQINHALHIAAVTQARHDTPGRTYYLRKINQGHTRREALRSLKRRISDAAYRHLTADATPVRTNPTANHNGGPGRATRDDSKVCVAGITP
jgi:transposase